jgi:hypothetical protein
VITSLPKYKVSAGSFTKQKLCRWFPFFNPSQNYIIWKFQLFLNPLSYLTIMGELNCKTTSSISRFVPDISNEVDEVVFAEIN